MGDGYPPEGGVSIWEPDRLATGNGQGNLTEAWLAGWLAFPGRWPVLDVHQVKCTDAHLRVMN
jgi:hypothetical protein